MKVIGHIFYMTKFLDVQSFIFILLGGERNSELGENAIFE